MKLYYLVGRALKIPLSIGFHLYCIVTQTPRVRIIARNERGELLLVRAWTNTREWDFPGGGVDRGESYEAAACRELREETGIVVHERQLSLAGTIHTWGHDEVLFSLAISTDTLPEKSPSPFEIQEMKWFSVAALPTLGSLAKKIVAKVDTNQ